MKRMMKILMGINNKRYNEKYIDNKSGNPAPTRNGTYGTPKIIAGRVHPRNKTSFFKSNPISACSRNMQPKISKQLHHQSTPR